MTILLNYHIGRIVLGSMCVGVLVWLGWGGIRVAGLVRCVLEFRCGWVGVVSVLQAEARELCFSLQHGYYSNPTTSKLQYTSNQEQYDQCGNSAE